MGMLRHRHRLERMAKEQNVPKVEEEIPFNEPEEIPVEEPVRERNKVQNRKPATVTRRRKPVK